MANIVKNSVLIKGSEENLLAFINEGLRNSGRAEATDLYEGVEDLVQNARHKTCEGDRFESPILNVVMDEGLTMGTFTPIPDTFIKYDTTNHPDLPQAKEQAEQYGVIGWAEYNRKVFGCRCDCELENFTIYKGVISFDIESLWTAPYNWYMGIKEKFGLDIYFYADEEFASFIYAGQVGGEIYDFATNKLRGGDYASMKQFRDAYERAKYRAFSKFRQMSQ